MKALVTGGAGFIGSYLCEELVHGGHEIIIIDNLFRGKYENIEHLLNENNLFFNVDLAETDNIPTLVALLNKYKPELIFHYAAINGTQYFYDIPSKVLEVNTMATRNLMQSLKEVCQSDNTYCPKILYASSSEVYGEPFHLPSRENDVTYVNVASVRDSYAAAKLIGEFYVKLIAEECHFPYINLRLFNVYGPRMIGTKYGQVIPEFITRLKGGEYPLRIYGDGSHMRSFCYVTDNVRLTVALALSNAENEIINIGNDYEISIKDLGIEIMKKMGKEPAFEFLKERVGDHKRRRPDTTKLHHYIGAYQFIELDEGIKRML